MKYKTKTVHSILWRQKQTYSLAACILFHTWQTRSLQIPTGESASWQRASLSQPAVSSCRQAHTASHWVTVKGVFVGSSVLAATPQDRVHRLTSPCSFHPSRGYSIHSRLLEPDSELPQELVPSPLGQKATLGVGITPVWHCPAPLCGRWSPYLQQVKRMRRAGSTGREKERWSRTSCLLYRAYIFIVTAYVLTHKGLCFFIKKLTRPVKFIWQMWPWTCACVCMCV